MNIRNRFPIFRHKVYINSCSQGALSVDVRRAYEDYMCDLEQKGSPWEIWVQKNEAVRHAFATLINAQPGEVAVETSTSAAISSVASALDFSSPRNKVVVSDFEFPTAGQIWHAQEARGAKITHVPAAGNVIPLERFENAIDERTKLVQISHVCYRNGSKLDVKAITEIAHRKGALVLVDAYQSLGTTPIDVKAWNVDFLAGGALKYLLAAPGLAFLYARKDLIPQLNPTTVGWFAQANIFAMDIYAHKPAPDARRFESGTPPVPNLYAGLAGMRLLQSVGVERIEAHVSEITGAIKEGAMRRGFNVVTPIQPSKHGAMIAIRSHMDHMLVKRLEEENIIVSCRDNNIRISPHLYNDLSDVSRLMDALTKHKELLV